MSDLIRRLNRLEKELNHGGDQIGHCKECGRHLCWKLDPSSTMPARDCVICPPVKFVVDLGNEPEPKENTICPTCGYENQVFLIDLGGERWNEGLEDEY